MTEVAVQNKLPSLEELLRRRGIEKSKDFDDYQDYVEEQEDAGVRPKLLNLRRIHTHGSMHLALGRIQSVRNFWSWMDRK